MKPLLLCTDLDRTLVPNGLQPESPDARECFARLAAQPEVTLAYVSGRHRELIQQAIAEYRLPQPDYVIADVGTTLYEIRRGKWRHSQGWEDEIAADWLGKTPGDLIYLLQHYSVLTLQEIEKQGRYKLSYYTPPNLEQAAFVEVVQEQLASAGVHATVIWSLDETTGTGLLDILPAGANKRHAIHFLASSLGMAMSEVVFAGDSGNDLAVMQSDIPSVLVANATDEVRQQVAAAGEDDTIYLALGGYLGMNGNYSAGILEGVAHFRPDIDAWLRQVA